MGQQQPAVALRRRHSLVWEAARPRCGPVTQHAIVEGIKTVRLKDFSHSAHSLQHDSRSPCSRMKKPAGPVQDRLAAATVIWSLVPYGSGWISNPKPIDMKQNDGPAFWCRFCQFCLHELPGRVPRRRRSADKQPGSGSTPAPKEGPLTGTWNGSTLIAKYRLIDNGKNVTVELAASEVLKKISGTLARPAGEPGQRP